MWDKIAEFFSRLVPESFLRSLIDGLSRALESRAPGALAKDILKTALVLVILGLAVDAWLYWSQKERRALLLRRFRRVQDICILAAESLRKTWRKLLAKTKRPDPEAEARAQAEAEAFSKLMVLDAHLEDAEENLTEMLEIRPEPETPKPEPEPEPVWTPPTQLTEAYVPAEVSTRRRPYVPETEELPEEAELPPETPPEAPAEALPAEAIGENRGGFARRNKHELPPAEPEAPLSGAERFWGKGEPK